MFLTCRWSGMMINQYKGTANSHALAYNNIPVSNPFPSCLTPLAIPQRLHASSCLCLKKSCPTAIVQAGAVELLHMPQPSWSAVLSIHQIIAQTKNFFRADWTMSWTHCHLTGLQCTNYVGPIVQLQPTNCASTTLESSPHSKTGCQADDASWLFCMLCRFWHFTVKRILICGSR